MIPPVLCFHTHFPRSHHVGCAHWAAGRGRRRTGAGRTGAGGRQTARRRAGHWRNEAGCIRANLIPKGPREAGCISSHFKLALVYLFGYSGWSNMYSQVMNYRNIKDGWLNHFVNCKIFQTIDICTLEVSNAEMRNVRWCQVTHVQCIWRMILLVEKIPNNHLECIKPCK